MSEREARLGLNSVTVPGDPQIASAVQQDGAEQTWSRLVSGELSVSRGSATRPQSDTGPTSRSTDRSKPLSPLHRTVGDDRAYPVRLAYKHTPELDRKELR